MIVHKKDNHAFKSLIMAKALDVDVLEQHVEKQPLVLEPHVPFQQFVLDNVPTSMMKETPRFNEDQYTISTGSESDMSIPRVVYIRTDLPPEVPSDEPLMNIESRTPLPVDMRRQGLRQTMTTPLHWFTHRRDKTRLSEDDLEAYKQTLVDL